MKYPKVGEKFYWKDCNGEISESYCKKVDKDPNSQIMTNYFIYLTPNGGGNFVVEEDILDPNSNEVIEFRKTICKEKVDKFINELNDEDIYNEILNRLNNKFLIKTAKDILNAIMYE